MESTIELLRDRMVTASERLRFAPLLGLRVVLGVVFTVAGWGKVQDLGRVAGFFGQLGIPAPHFNAALVGWSELLCGIALLVGLATRFATIPLIVTMIVALATAKRGELSGVTALFGVVDFAYLVMLFTLLVLGPGAASVDALVARAIDARRTSGDPGHPRAGRPAYAH
jgi:putative oxidoreductase